MSILDKLQSGRITPSTTLMQLLQKVTSDIEKKKGVSPTQALDFIRVAFNRTYPDTPVSEGGLYAWYTGRRRQPHMDVGIRMLFFLDKF